MLIQLYPNTEKRNGWIYLSAVFDEDRIVAEAKIKVLLGRNGGKFGNQITVIGREELNPNGLRVGGGFEDRGD